MHTENKRNKSKVFRNFVKGKRMLNRERKKIKNEGVVTDVECVGTKEKDVLNNRSKLKCCDKKRKN